MIAAQSKPSFAILLCTYNGAAHLREQIDSYAAQTCADWTLAVSDDGSTDDTLEILRSDQRLAGRLAIFAGPRQGFAQNFLSLACRREVEAECYAFSDQDDVWHADRLDRALSRLRELPEDRPALYCSRTAHVDGSGRPLGLSPVYAGRPSFANALAQNVAGGNTMVVNAAAMALIREAGPVRVLAHDWWLYMLITGAGGTVVYDRKPTLDYRQHGANVIGGTVATGTRARRLLEGRFQQWNDLNIAALQSVDRLLTPAAHTTLQKFVAARQAWLPKRLVLLAASGVHRQTRGGSLAFWLAALLGKI